jgi:hypothetical protein
MKGVRWAPFVVLTVFVEVTFKVSMAFEYVHNFEDIIDVAEKNHNCGMQNCERQKATSLARPI